MCHPGNTVQLTAKWANQTSDLGVRGSSPCRRATQTQLNQLLRVTASIGPLSSISMGHSWGTETRCRGPFPIDLLIRNQQVSGSSPLVGSI